MKATAALTLVVIVGITLVSGAARADQAEHPGGTSMESMSEMMRGMPMGSGSGALGRERPQLGLALRHRAQLGLSEDQVKTLEGLVDRFARDAKDRLRDIEAAERELVALLKQEPGDLAPVETQVRAIEKLRADLRIARIRTITEGRAALTAEQRTQLDRLVTGHRPQRRSGAAERGSAGDGLGSRGVEEMHRFMSSERMPQAMTAMMAMAERMGDGDPMLGMVRMMEMMSMMGGTMGESVRPEAPREEKQ